MTEPKEESFSGDLTNQPVPQEFQPSPPKQIYNYGWSFGPNPYAPTTERISEPGICGGGDHEVIQMQPQSMTNPYRYSGQTSAIQIEPSSAPLISPARSNATPQVQKSTGIDKLEILKDYDKFFLDYTNESLINVIAGGSPDSNNIIMKVQMVSRRGRKNEINNTSMRFLDLNSRTLFQNERIQFRSQVVCDDIALAEISGDACGCSRKFHVSSHTSNVSFQVTPQGICGAFPFCMCNYCLINEYFIYDARTNDKVGSITCGEIQVTLDFNSSGSQLDTSSKAMLLAASVTIFELYFAPCCGNVGTMGSRCICAAVLTLVPLFIGLILVIFHIGVRGS